MNTPFKSTIPCEHSLQHPIPCEHSLQTPYKYPAAAGDISKKEMKSKMTQELIPLNQTQLPDATQNIDLQGITFFCGKITKLITKRWFI